MQPQYFFSAFGHLSEGQRLRETVDLCEATVDTARDEQFKALCLENLGEYAFFSVGDAELARENCKAAIDMMDADIGVLYSNPMPDRRTLMEDMYIKLCEMMAQLAVSFDEYFEYMEKIKKFRNLTPLQSGQVELVESLKAEGRDWAYNIQGLADRYISSGGFGASAALHYLLIANRRQLRLPRGHLEAALVNYSKSVRDNVTKCMSVCNEKRIPCNPYNYLFLVDKAIGTVESCIGDVQNKEPVDAELEALRDLKEKLEEIDRKSAERGYNYTGPGYKSLADMRRWIEENDADAPEKPVTKDYNKAGGYFSLIILLLGGGLLAYLTHTQAITWNWLRIALVVIAGIVLLANVINGFKNSK